MHWPLPMHIVASPCASRMRSTIICVVDTFNATLVQYFANIAFATLQWG